MPCVPSGRMSEYEPGPDFGTRLFLCADGLFGSIDQYRWRDDPDPGVGGAGVNRRSLVRLIVYPKIGCNIGRCSTLNSV